MLQALIGVIALCVGLVLALFMLLVIVSSPWLLAVTVGLTALCVVRWRDRRRADAVT